MVQRIILANDTEVSYAKQNGLDDSLDLSLIPIIKRITNKNRINLKQNTNKIVNEINGKIDEYPESNIIFFAQFNKGDLRSEEELEIIKEIQLKSNLDTFVFQELSENETIDNSKKEFNKIKKLAEDKKIFVVLDIKSKDIEDKIDFFLLGGVKNFIIRGGDYNNFPKWIEIRESIHKFKGDFIISLYGRWDRDKVSYIKYALSLGCDFTFHEKPAPYPVDMNSILNLNDNFVYELIPVDGDYGITVNEDNKYSFSRIRALLKAQELSPNIGIVTIS